MKVVCISDTHMRKFDVPEGDMLIHAGDALSYGNLRELATFLPWFKAHPHPIKIYVAGNHDRIMELGMGRKLVEEAGGIIYLEDRATFVDRPEGGQPGQNNLLVYGSPWQPRFFDWAFNLNRKSPELKAKWDLIPHGLDILITHGPPHGILDKTDRGEHAGCELLRDRVEEVKPKYHVFGHIHRAYGVEKVGETTFINAAICGENYRPDHKPIVFEV